MWIPQCVDLPLVVLALLLFPFSRSADVSLTGLMVRPISFPLSLCCRCCSCWAICASSAEREMLSASARDNDMGEWGVSGVTGLLTHSSSIVESLLVEGVEDRDRTGYESSRGRANPCVIIRSPIFRSPPSAGSKSSTPGRGVPSLAAEFTAAEAFGRSL